MRRTFWIVVLAVVAFAVIVVSRLPASWVMPSGSRAGFSCASVDGSIWSGVCAGAVVQRIALGDLTWDLRPVRLLTGALAAHVTLAHGPISARGDVALGLGQRLTLRNLTADLPIDRRALPQLPRDLSGTLHLDLALARIERGAITELQGRLEAHDLVDSHGHSTPLGSYALTFPGADLTGQLQDLGGPLSVSGTVRLTPGPGYAVQGLVAARPGATPDLVNNLSYLGSADAQGRRPFSMAGTF
ncbi:MAG: type II secretion system protein N [Steroidobacteraceae bacterium]